MKQLLEDHSLILMEAAIVERLRRSGTVKLHETLLNAPLIYQSEASAAMSRVYEEYLSLARDAKLPMLVCTPTWRANQERVVNAGISDHINQDAARYMQPLRDNEQYLDTTIKIGGLMGCKNDCYLPDQGLTTAEARDFHAWQADQLAEGGVDFLIAQTLPNVQEALGIAQAMERTGFPYIISFVLSREGNILDGTALSDAITLIDNNTQQAPLGYMVNCAHPSFLRPAEQPEDVFRRLMGYQANASSLDHCELENAGELQADDVQEWGALMLELNRRYAVTALGGCCGTDARHLESILSD